MSELELLLIAAAVARKLGETLVLPALCFAVIALSIATLNRRSH
jgi:hypothetical protein